ncbi:uncharacterized protein [Magallana gigas]|uniref:uncharacterized protein n=1 Tax=Magallana gigas TaxID=29159 RepID=UPI003340BAFB
MLNLMTGICIFQLFYFSADVFCMSNAIQCKVDKYYNPNKHNCTDCLPGYYKTNCSDPCRYPNYGLRCQKECNCPEKSCHHVFGCPDHKLDGSYNDNGVQLIIGLSVGFGVVLVIAAFLVINIANRRFYTRHIRANARYIGSVVTEHSLTANIYKPKESYSCHCNGSEATDSSVYTLAGTLRYEHMNLE